MYRSAIIRAAALAAVFLAQTVGGAAAQTTTLDHKPSYSELLQILKTAKPAPNPVRSPLLAAPQSTGPRDTVEFDPATNRVRIVPHHSAPSAQGATESDPENKGPGAPRGPDGRSADIPFDSAPEDLDRPFITPTAPSPTTDSLTFPRNTVFKMLTRFNVGSTDFYWVCSGSARGSFLVLTAGHCIYNWDPNDDKNTSDKAFANEIWLWAAQTDRVIPIGDLDFPYGVAKGTFMRTYTNWTDSQDLDYDYAVVSLDRRQGDHTGWMGAETSVGTSLNFTGYPTETPYVPDDEYRQYPGFDSGNVSDSTDTRITLDAFLYGGHSGGPAWRFKASDGTRNVEGINSTSDRVGSADETRITDYIIDHFTAARNADETDRPPVARPSLIEYTFATDMKDLLTNSVDQGGTIGIELNGFNAGFANAENTAFDIYLSSNTTISSTDRYIGTVNYGGLGPFTYANFNTTVSIPLSTPPKNYYVGWILRTSTPEYETDDNAVVISNELLTVRPTPRLSLTPGTGLSSSGVQGGPFSPSSASYTIQNAGTGTLNWSASSNQNWATVSPASGTLGKGASQSVSISINANANTLAANNYSATVSFTNTNNGIGNTSRAVALAVKRTFTVSVSASPTAGGSVSGGGTGIEGSSRTVKATPSSLYRFVNWTEGSTVVSTAASYTFTLSANRTLVAHFAILTYKVTVSASPTARGTVSGGGTFNAGTSRTVKATAQSGSVFINWTEGGAQVSNKASYTFTLSANRTLVAHFKPAHVAVNDLVVDLGPAGLWEYLNNTTWKMIRSSSSGLLTTGDLNGDGKDEVVATFADGLWTRYANDGTWYRLSIGIPTQIAVADLDNTGKAEVIANYSSGVFARFNNAGNFVKLSPSNTTALAALDLNGNGKAEVVGVFASGTLARYDNAGAFQSLTTHKLLHLVQGDLNGDGRPDLIGDATGVGIEALIANTKPWVTLNRNVPLRLTAGDLNGNGKAEVIAVFPNGTIARYDNAGSFVRLHTRAIIHPATVDLDKNGKDDLVGDISGQGLYAFKNNAAPWVRLNTSTSQGIAAGGFD